MGPIFKVHVRHDNSSFSNSWFLDRVEVNDKKDKYVFLCERWLSKSKEDKLIERTLFEKVNELQLMAGLVLLVLVLDCDFYSNLELSRSTKYKYVVVFAKVQHRRFSIHGQSQQNSHPGAVSLGRENERLRRPHRFIQDNHSNWRREKLRHFVPSVHTSLRTGQEAKN